MSNLLFTAGRTKNLQKLAEDILQACLDANLVGKFRDKLPENDELEAAAKRYEIEYIYFDITPPYEYPYVKSISLSFGIFHFKDYIYYHSGYTEIDEVYRPFNHTIWIDVRRRLHTITRRISTNHNIKHLHLWWTYRFPELSGTEYLAYLLYQRRDEMTRDIPLPRKQPTRRGEDPDFRRAYLKSPVDVLQYGTDYYLKLEETKAVCLIECPFTGRIVPGDRLSSKRIANTLLVSPHGFRELVWKGASISEVSLAIGREFVLFGEPNAFKGSNRFHEPEEVIPVRELYWNPEPIDGYVLFVRELENGARYPIVLPVVKIPTGSKTIAFSPPASHHENP